MKTDQQRITELEIQLSHLQRQYDVLNEVLTDQAGQIDRVVTKIKRWENDVELLKNAMESGRDIQDEKPPHY